VTGQSIRPRQGFGGQVAQPVARAARTEPIIAAPGPGERGEFALHSEFAEHGGRAPSTGSRRQGLVGVGNLPRQ
jgi:hypothetical protein